MISPGLPVERMILKAGASTYIVPSMDFILAGVGGIDRGPHERSRAGHGPSDRVGRAVHMGTPASTMSARTMATESSPASNRPGLAKSVSFAGRTGHDHRRRHHLAALPALGSQRALLDGDILKTENAASSNRGLSVPTLRPLTFSSTTSQFESTTISFFCPRYCERQKWGG